MVLSLRRKANLKVRQPLKRIMVPAIDDVQRSAIESMKDLILNEVNVKELDMVSADSGVLVKKVKPDFKKLGPKFGKLMKQAAAAIQSLSQADITALEREGSLAITIEGNTVMVDSADVEIISEDIPGWLVANEGNLTVALDITVTDELRQEGIARDIVNRVQNIRKSRNYDITDKITLTFAPSPLTDDAIANFGDYIARQVLATAVVIAPVADGAEGAEVLELDELNIPTVITLS